MPVCLPAPLFFFRASNSTQNQRQKQQHQYISPANTHKALLIALPIQKSHNMKPNRCLFSPLLTRPTHPPDPAPEPNPKQNKNTHTQRNPSSQNTNSYFPFYPRPPLTPQQKANQYAPRRSNLILHSSLDNNQYPFLPFLSFPFRFLFSSLFFPLSPPPPPLLASLLLNQKREKKEKKFKQKTQRTATRCRTPVGYSKKPISQINLLLLLRLLNTSRAIPRSQAGNGVDNSSSKSNDSTREEERERRERKKTQRERNRTWLLLLLQIRPADVSYPNYTSFRYRPKTPGARGGPGPARRGAGPRSLPGVCQWERVPCARCATRRRRPTG